MLTVVSTSGGSVTASPGVDCASGYSSGRTVTLTAVPDAGYVLQWSGDLSGNANPASIVMNAPKTVTATFVSSIEHYTVAVEVASADLGTVTLNPLPPGAEGYPVNQRVTLTASPDTGYTFSRWVGDLTGNSNQASIIANANKTITAVFNATVTLTPDPIVGGTVSLNPLQSPDGYTIGTAVTVTATALKGYRFDQWSGDLTGSNSSATITMDSAKQITANFVKKAPFPWWWIVIGIVLLFPVLVMVRVAYVVMGRRADRT